VFVLLCVLSNVLQSKISNQTAGLDCFHNNITSAFKMFDQLRKITGSANHLKSPELFWD